MVKYPYFSQCYNHIVDLSEFRKILTKECQIKGIHPLIVGVSGGADSLCLLSLLASLKLPIVVVHFDHKLRSESNLDAQFVAKIAADLGYRYVLGEADVRALAKKEHLSLEAAARRARYTFLFDQARAIAAEAVIVGHTADDQVETILLHLLRGSGLNGLQGMSYRTIIDTYSTEIPLVRPLLGFWREETVGYCDIHGLHPLEDQTNQDRRFQRNRLRHELIPILETYNPQVKKRLWSLAQVAKSSLASPDEMNKWIYRRCIINEKQGEYVSMDSKLINELPDGTLQNLLRQAVQQVQPELADFDFQAVRRAVRLVRKREQTGRVDLGGNLELIKVHGQIYISAVGTSLPSDDWPQFSANEPLMLVIPGKTVLAGGWSIQAVLANLDDREAISENSDEALLDPESLSTPLIVRRRQPGDRLQPLGMSGTIKLSDFFINQKIPRLARAAWPLISCGVDIVWVAGLRISEKFRVKAANRQAIHLQLVKD